MTQQNLSHALLDLSSELANVVEQVTPSVVRVNDGSRLTATGIIWSADGIIVATSHGVERDEELSIERADGTVLPATLVGRDPDTDLAVLRVEATDLPAVQRADPAEVKVGQLALALGRPGISGVQATLGIITARRETQTHGQAEYVLTTDADFYPGFSGGPLVNVRGQVVGINNRMFGRGSGVSLGVPTIATVAEALLKRGRVQRGYLGVRAQQVVLPESLRTALSLEQEGAALIAQVEAGSPADQGGLMLGDTLLAIGEQVIEDVDALRQSLRSLAAGQVIAITIARGGVRHTLNVTLGTE